MLTLTFQDLGINPARFNGLTFVQAFQAIVNIAADRITQAAYYHPDTNIETLYNWGGASIDMISQRISIPATDYDIWVAVNS